MRRNRRRIGGRAALSLFAAMACPHATWAEELPEIPRPPTEATPSAGWLSRLPPADAALPKLTPLTDRSSRHGPVSPRYRRGATEGHGLAAPQAARGSEPRAQSPSMPLAVTVTPAQGMRDAGASTGADGALPGVPPKRAIGASDWRPQSNPESRPADRQASDTSAKQRRPTMADAEPNLTETRVANRPQPERPPEGSPSRSAAEADFSDLPGRDAKRAEAHRTPDSGYRWQVQLLAGRSLERVEEDRQLFSERYSKMLEGLRLTISPSDDGRERGAFYRLRALDWADPTEAANWCARLRQSGHDCLVIRVGNAEDESRSF